jgi:hypothetical protein
LTGAEEREAGMGVRIGRKLVLGVLALAGAAFPLEVQVTYWDGNAHAQVRVLHRPDQEPLAAIRLRLKLKAAAQALGVAKPESGPWSQFLPAAALDGRSLSVFAMAPATGIGRDSSARLIADFDLSLPARAGTLAAADLIDSAIVEEAYGPDGKPLALRSMLTTSLRRARPAAPEASWRERGAARSLAFNLARAQRVRAWISDVRGRRVAAVADRTFAAGVQEVTWDGKSAGGAPPARGTYLFHLEGATFSYARKLEVAP